MCAGWTEHLLKTDTHNKTTISNDDQDKDKEEPRNDQETSGSCKPMSPLMRVILLQPFTDLIQTHMLVKSSVRTKMMPMCHSWFQVQEKLKYRRHFNGQQTKIKFGYLAEIYFVSFPALHPCHHIPSETNHHLALIKARSSQYKN